MTWVGAEAEVGSASTTAGTTATAESEQVGRRNASNRRIDRCISGVQPTSGMGGRFNKNAKLSTTKSFYTAQWGDVTNGTNFRLHIAREAPAYSARSLPGITGRRYGR